MNQFGLNYTVEDRDDALYVADDGIVMNAGNSGMSLYSGSALISANNLEIAIGENDETRIEAIDNILGLISPNMDFTSTTGSITLRSPDSIGLYGEGEGVHLSATTGNVIIEAYNGIGANATSGIGLNNTTKEYTSLWEPQGHINILENSNIEIGSTDKVMIESEYNSVDIYGSESVRINGGIVNIGNTTSLVTIHNLSTPTKPTEPTTKQYVDNLIETLTNTITNLQAQVQSLQEALAQKTTVTINSWEDES